MLGLVQFRPTGAIGRGRASQQSWLPQGVYLDSGVAYGIHSEASSTPGKRSLAVAQELHIDSNKYIIYFQAERGFFFKEECAEDTT